MRRLIAIVPALVLLFTFTSCSRTETTETPGGVTEEEVTVNAGSGYPLDGLLALPESGAKVALVLVHGSGPADKDETIGANKPFRDIAYALAGKDVAVLRYDKRTLAYGAEIAGDAEAMAKLTVYDETIYDAVAAVKLLKNRFEKVYVLGHSMSGGLLAEINASGAGCDGYIVMEGTPRKLYELSAEQNLLYADELEGDGKTDDAEQIRAFVRSELTKAAQLSALPDADALKAENAVFGMGAWYLRSFEGIDTLGLHLKDGKPVLVLQGGRDRQVTEKDFDLWKAGLSAHPDAAFKLYPALNHVMGEYQGETVPFSELVTREYAQSTPVSVDVTNDICDWILNTAAKPPRLSGESAPTGSENDIETGGDGAQWQPLVKQYMDDKFTQAFSPYYEVLRFTMTNYEENTSDGTLTATFLYTMTHRNYYKDPDTVLYIKEAKESGSPYYQTYYDEYNADKEGNFDLQFTAKLSDDETIDISTAVIWNNSAATGGAVYTPIEAEDFIMPGAVPSRP
ncbi:MAG: lysophospholipase [Clostridiales Family XIII bacterium]|nr:lysophospholipase [Clostridiales Family XIII bacterium]